MSVSAFRLQHPARAVVMAALITGAGAAAAQPATVAPVAPAMTPAAASTSAPPGAAVTAAPKVVVSGTVPDEATRAAILARVREVYGAERVVDQLGVGPLAAPPQWSQQVQKLLTPDIKRISQGQLKIEGNVVEVSGQVDSAQTQAQLLKTLATRLDNPTYTVRDNLRVGASGQQVLDTALANRIVEFEPGNATLTPIGQRVLDDLLPVLQQLNGRRFEIVGHTDSDGTRQHNLLLSAARAESVKAYLTQRGIAAAALVTSGLGPDKPVADNLSAAGRARNRRIEFRLLA
ncbi:OmpA family protein [Aquabacterium sp.]|uniref:OmpA family protein n=1 Tax=Aquabacterium sp. TaxID=1872578 RepID=UPI002CE110F5|nr:OmpA family protein [Aquabacterium sp.]HSW04151.1 OmpA family protein [Aquabacterium sp.]